MYPRGVYYKENPMVAEKRKAHPPYKTKEDMVV